jgi:hypothetical protein
MIEISNSRPLPNIDINFNPAIVVRLPYAGD